jgi:hypothetical protein
MNNKTLLTIVVASMNVNALKISSYFLDIGWETFLSTIFSFT